MLVLLFRLLSFLPLPVLHALGVAAGWLAYLASPRYRKHLRNNIHQAGLGQYLSTAIGEAGKNILELPFIWCAAPERVLRSGRIENWAVVEAARAKGKGLLFLTPHLGCFEISAQLASVHEPMTVMYRPPKQAALKPLIEGARARTNLSLAPANLSGVRSLFKVLKRGGAIGVLPDQVPQNGEGVWADFFGKPAYTMTLPGKLAEMTDAAIVLAYAERLPRGKGYVLHMSSFELPAGLSPQQQATAINAAMEKLILRCPAQYFWSYNHYKVPSGVTPPDAQSDGKEN
ncbi:MAG: lysophospholipid acyltransferase family protein [Oxalicibacterium faecigallinarum]|uniref:lysophospholipid acyltransferase family protein n=1 Tax=Oxalicibacterium faecigallinarum TaxID=573741 RepID=UPI0028081FFD|nr:lysophospholipid acyltransferase family protein [Oxalicibacterium faecigallinarum]MDQ7969047.1 lysophospholipid acyltransferase family protein [Oxalicibacterium faecigallinarum]